MTDAQIANQVGDPSSRIDDGWTRTKLRVSNTKIRGGEWPRGHTDGEGWTDRSMRRLSRCVSLGIRRGATSRHWQSWPENSRELDRLGISAAVRGSIRNETNKTQSRAKQSKAKLGKDKLVTSGVGTPVCTVMAAELLVCDGRPGAESGEACQWGK